MSAAALAIKDLGRMTPRDLRAILDQQFPNATPVPRRERDTVETSISALDAIFPHGGFPKGRLTVWAPYGGATAIVRTTALATVLAGERVAWIDGQGTVAGAFWSSGPILVRPRNRTHALRAADVLLRSGGFALVVLTGVELEGNENVRLARATHEGGSAFVALTSNAAMAGLKVASSITPSDYLWQRTPHGDPAKVDAVTVHVKVASLGWNRRAKITLHVQSDDPRAALDLSLPDRRGVTRSALRAVAQLSMKSAVTGVQSIKPLGTAIEIVARR
jgi:hypothetical protein